MTLGEYVEFLNQVIKDDPTLSKRKMFYEARPDEDVFTPLRKGITIRKDSNQLIVVVN
jgi:hypothetical protein